jgi:hypothetical protein
MVNGLYGYILFYYFMALIFLKSESLIKALEIKIEIRNGRPEGDSNKKKQYQTFKC